jgi:tetratricopeptide (TPR) repeat protein
LEYNSSAAADNTQEDMNEIGSSTGPWTEAMRLFDEAERHYKGEQDDDDEHDDDENDHPDLVKVLDNQASLFRKHGQNDMALAKYRELLQLLEVGSSVEEEALLEARMNVADCLAATGECQEAISHYHHLLERVSHTDNNDDDDVSEDNMAMECALRHNLGAIYAKQGHMERALDQYSIGLTLKRSMGGDFHPEVASTLSGMAAVHATMGSPGRALHFFKEALLIHRSNHPNNNTDHPDIQNTLRNIVLLEQAQRTNKKQRQKDTNTFS